ncbi:hypothetical protein [Jannaschia seosinensis]|uniref:hypothetical protein n=1 Tax=Jannaschia seosinensis TaxID=313367 RepID=UPI000AE70DDE|nr:hypothetical protein [Jannaschia seosinensis]
MPSRAAGAQDALTSRAAELRGATIPVPGGDDVVERGRQLRERAAALRAVEI